MPEGMPTKKTRRGERDRGRERDGENKREREQEWEWERQRGREAPRPLAPPFVCFLFFPLPLGLPYVNWASQECCLFYLRSSLLSSGFSFFYFHVLFPFLSFGHRHSGLRNYSDYLTLGFCTLTAKGRGLIPQWGNKIHKPRGMQNKRRYAQGSSDYLCSDYYFLKDSMWGLREIERWNMIATF